MYNRIEEFMIYDDVLLLLICNDNTIYSCRYLSFLTLARIISEIYKKYYCFPPLNVPDKKWYFFFVDGI